MLLDPRLLHPDLLVFIRAIYWCAAGVDVESEKPWEKQNINLEPTATGSRMFTDTIPMKIHTVRSLVCFQCIHLKACIAFCTNSECEILNSITLAKVVFFPPFLNEPFVRCWVSFLSRQISVASVVQASVFHLTNGSYVSSFYVFIYLFYADATKTFVVQDMRQLCSQNIFIPRSIHENIMILQHILTPNASNTWWTVRVP